ncbi:MAG: hypothetical protein J6Q45_00085, partial [Alistipes sp.]|nr:hypothetical protein [Alistipes sp.]
MKKTFRLSALLCAMTLLVTSCSKNILDEPVIDPALNGTEIQFGSRAGFENANPNTRTVYSGETYTGTNGAKFERIDWVDDDQVTIYSPEAGGLNPAHYKVTQASVDENGAGNDVYDEGYLTKLMDGGLQWNTAKTTHTFYAMYPSPLQLPTGIQNLVGLDYSGDDVKINAYISNEQHSQGVDAYDASGNVVDLSAANAAASVKRYEVKPDMRFAYMAAKNTVDTGTADVTLDFVPVVTALRIELFLPTSYQDGDKVVTSPDTSIGYVQLNCNGIAGAYTADLNDYVDGYPACENVGDAVNSIGMLINGNDNLPITLKAGQSLCFTVFVRPGADINLKDIKVSFGLDAMSIRTKRLGTDATTNVIASFKKTSITGLKLPQTTSTITLTYEKWMSQIKDEAKISELSILGTGGSFSSSYTGSNQSHFKQQTMPVFAERDADGNITKMGQ